MCPRAGEASGAIGAIHLIAAVAAFDFQPDTIAETPAKAEQTDAAIIKAKLATIGLAKRRHALAQAAIQAKLGIVQVIHAEPAGDIRPFNKLGARRRRRAKPDDQGGGWGNPT
jgi:hypothetical protein